MTERKTVTRDELAAALHEHTLHNEIGGVDDSLAKMACEQSGRLHCLWKADAIFAALPESADEGLREAAQAFLAAWDMGPPLPRNDFQLAVATLRAALSETSHD